MTAIRPILLASCVLALTQGCSDTSVSAADDPNLFTVARRNLSITVKEQAELQAIRETIVRSEVEGQATIIFLVQEGKIVEKGEKLVELDTSDLVDKCNSQKITVGKADAAYVQAKKALEILQKDLRAKRNTAESNLRIAQMELEKCLGRDNVGDSKQGKNADMVRKLRELVTAGEEEAKDPAAQKGEVEEPLPTALVAKIDPTRYQALVAKVTELLQVRKPGQEAPPASALDRDMGEMSNKVLQQVDKIRLAMADLKYQETYYTFSRKLEKKQFYTHTELEKDAIELQRRISNVGLAWNDLDLLISYELPKEHIKLEQDVENAQIELERVVASNENEVTKAESDLKSKELEYNLVKGRLDTLERQIRNAVMLAPTPGMVIYARVDRNSRNSESIREGSQVRERQDLIILPDTTRMQAIVKVQEAVVAQVRPRQRAHVEVEAQPNRVFPGVVNRVAQQADSNTGWMSNDRKVYTTVVELDDENSDQLLRSRMAAAVTIMVEELKDVLVVPLQAVRRDRSVNYVWRQAKKAPEAIPVKTGKHNAEHLVIEEGLAAGDSVYLTPPPGVAAPSFPQPEAPAAVAPEQVQNGNGGHTADAHGPNASDNGEGQGQKGKQKPPLDDEAKASMAAMRKTSEDVKAWLLQKYPDRAADVEDRRARMEMLADASVQDALKAENPTLWERYDEMRKAMRGPGNQGGQPGGKGDGGGRGRGGKGGE